VSIKVINVNINVTISNNYTYTIYNNVLIKKLILFIRFKLNNNNTTHFLIDGYKKLNIKTFVLTFSGK